MSQVATEVQDFDVITFLKTSFQGLNDMVLGAYFDRIKSEVYEKWAKNIFVGKYSTSQIGYATYMRFLNGADIPKSYESHIVLNLASLFTLILTVSIIIYLILSYFKLVSPFNGSFKPRAFGSISFYTFLLLPFKNSILFVSIRGFFSDALELMPIDELIFIACVVIVLFSKDAIASIAKKHKLLANYTKTMFEAIKLAIFTSALLLYALNTSLSPKTGHFIAGSIIILFITVLLLLSLRKKLLNITITVLFSFISSLAFLSYFVVLVSVILRSIGLFNHFYNSLISVTKIILGTDKFFIFASLAVFAGFVIYCIIPDQAKRPIYEDFASEFCRDFEERVMISRNDASELEKLKDTAFRRINLHDKCYTYDKDIFFFKDARKEWLIFNRTHSILNQALKQTEKYTGIQDSTDPTLIEVKDSIIKEIGSLDFSKSPDMSTFWPTTVTYDTNKLKPVTFGYQFWCIGRYDYAFVLLAINDFIEECTLTVYNTLNDLANLSEGCIATSSNSNKEFESRIDTVAEYIECICLLRENYKIALRYQNQNGCLTPSLSGSLNEEDTTSFSSISSD